MSGREWKPGDVAMVRYPIWGGSSGDTTYESRRVARFDGGWARLDDPDDFVLDDNPTQHFEPRPLVVIDPEDAEQIGRLAKAWHQAEYAELGKSPMSLPQYRLQAALREFANPTPPKPDEPTGLGAVVEDVHGERWVRGPSHNSWKWLRADRPGCDGYADITAVRVLSEGVSDV